MERPDSLAFAFSSFFSYIEHLNWTNSRFICWCLIVFYRSDVIRHLAYCLNSKFVMAHFIILFFFCDLWGQKQDVLWQWHILNSYSEAYPKPQPKHLSSPYPQLIRFKKRSNQIRAIYVNMIIQLPRFLRVYLSVSASNSAFDFLLFCNSQRLSVLFSKNIILPLGFESGICLLEVSL